MRTDMSSCAVLPGWTWFMMWTIETPLFTARRFESLLTTDWMIHSLLLCSCRSLWDAERLSGRWADDPGGRGFGCCGRWLPPGDQPYPIPLAGVRRYGRLGPHCRKTSHAVPRRHPAGQYHILPCRLFFVVSLHFCFISSSDDRRLMLVSISVNVHNLWACSSGSFCAGQRPSRAVHHAGETQGQRSVRVGHHRAIRGARLRGARDHSGRASAHQILRSDHVAHPRPFAGGVRPVSAATGICWGSVEGAKARTVSA